MNASLRLLLHRIEFEPNFYVTVPDVESPAGQVECRLAWAARLHHETVFWIADGGFHQANLAIVIHPRSGQPHAFVIASHHDHEGPWQEFLLCDDLLDCTTWDCFLDVLYACELDSGLDLTITNRDDFLALMPVWLDAMV